VAVAWRSPNWRAAAFVQSRKEFSSMLRELAAAPIAPVGVDEPQVAYEPIAIPRHTSRWGAPIWPAEQPITTREREPVGQVDLIVLSVMLAYRPE
jgi:hypothetical protein